MIANCAMCSGLQSAFAPTSRSSVGRPDFEGSIAASAGRSTPGSMPMTIFAVAIAAPVLPAETKPSAWPSATSRAPTRMELLRLRRTAVATASSIEMNSGASTNQMPLSPSLRQPQRRSSLTTTSVWPTSITPTPKSRAAASAPSISGCGARSLPIASTTTLPVRLVCVIKGAPYALSLLLNLYDFAAVVVAALLADAVRHARLLAVLAENRLRRAQRVVRAALARARFGVASFRIRHLWLLGKWLIVNGEWWLKVKQVEM